MIPILATLVSAVQAEEEEERMRANVIFTGGTQSNPQFVSAEIGTVNGSTVAVTFDIEVSSAPAVTIKENGVTTTHDGGTIQGDAHIVHYVIPIPWHGSDDVITVDDNAVTNNIAWAALLDLQADTGVTTSVTGFSGTGTVAQSGNSISGVGTVFLTEVVIGDVITATGISGTVTAIASNTVLTLSSSATAGAAAYTITPQAGTARVTTWADQSENANDFTKSGTGRPSKQTVSSYPAIVFDGKNDDLIGEDFADNLSSFTVMGIYTAPQVLSYAISKADAGGTQGWAIDGSGTNGYTADNSVYNGSSLPLDTDTTVKAVYTMEFQSRSVAHIYHNGDNSEETTYNDTVADHSIAEVVKIGTAYGDYQPINIYAEMIFAPAPSTTDRAALETRLGARYGLTVP